MINYVDLTPKSPAERQALDIEGRLYASYQKEHGKLCFMGRTKCRIDSGFISVSLYVGETDERYDWGLFSSPVGRAGSMRLYKTITEALS